MERNNNDLKRVSNKARLQSAISDIINGYLLLNEAVEKYEVAASTIIKCLKNIRDEKEGMLQLNNSKTQTRATNDSGNIEENQ
ncbi:MULTISPECIES: hypothetical protein [Sphingobacterium]|uniref:hypothetical protein n=1 Tax=Sphingobacterium TaxID=28453 RepID=UPI0010495699|nr:MULTISPECIES: hypothetical protein [Sphingobacterium]MCW2262144.1 exonuclease VII small subunit [Sphingobacterium kitahiroshimense]TCR13109.1 hypothetical protein EDF67_102523 [Sphingobacterium sp. JUb78]